MISKTESIVKMSGMETLEYINKYHYSIAPFSILYFERDMDSVIIKQRWYYYV